MKRVLLALLLVVSVASVAAAQRGRFGFGFLGYPPRFPKADTFGHGFNFCRAMYTSTRREPGGQGWSTDYPDAELNFSTRLSELTKTHVSKDTDGKPNHVVVRLTDPALFQCPYLHMEDVGTAGLTDAEIEGLREYLLKGGFVWADDYWGTTAWDVWASEMSRILPPSEYPIHDVPPDHPIFRTLFDVKSLPQIPSIQFWRSSGGGTSERGSESATPHIRGVSDKHGNLIFLMTHNTDISDAWEREGEDPRFFYSFSPNGYALGIDVIVYAMTH